MKSLMASSVVLIIAGVGVMVAEIPNQDHSHEAVVTGRLMSSAELQQVTGANNAGPCASITDCASDGCVTAGASCSSCTGTGMDQFCAGTDGTPCRQIKEECGERVTGTCDGSNCVGSQTTDKICTRTRC